MAIPKYLTDNFQTMLKAAANGDLALVQVTKKTGGDAYAICAITKDGEQYTMTPFGEMAIGNPFDIYNPPITDAEEAKLDQQALGNAQFLATTLAPL